MMRFHIIPKSTLNSTGGIWSKPNFRAPGKTGDGHEGQMALASRLGIGRACQLRADMAKAGGITPDPVKFRVALPAADPPDTQDKALL